jgi:hypothetical protein
MVARTMEAAQVDLADAQVGVLGALFRYEVMNRLARSADGQRVAVLGFGFSREELRLVLQGDDEGRTNVLRGVKVGTLRAVARWGRSLKAGRSQRTPILRGELLDHIAWCHLGPIEAGADGPLASPWSSHRDILGFRRAGFYDPAVVAGRIDVHELHRRCGGERLPSGWPPPGGHEDLALLLRVAGAVVGVLPADRRCFRVFVHLARARGWGNAALADALSLSRRRVRQLASEREPRVDMALAALAGPLSRVP